MNAVVYARVSTEEQGEGYGLSSQVYECEKFAKDKGYKVLATFQDKYTGTRLDRPGMDDLLDYIKLNQVDAVVAHDGDRLSRKLAHYLVLEEQLANRGVIIDCVKTPNDDSDETNIVPKIKQVLHEAERYKIIERMRRGKRDKARQGFVVVGARPPYGYKKISEPHKTWLEIDQDEAKIVKLIFSLYVNDGLSIRAISKRLTELSIPTRGDKSAVVAKKHGVGIWQPAMARHVLINETYIGNWYFGKTKMVKDGVKRPYKSKRGDGKQVPRDRSEWQVVDVPRIIDNDTFTHAQARLEKNKAMSTRNTKHPYLMRGRLKCSKCGYGINSITRRVKHRYYICNGKRQVTKLCDIQGFRADIVDEVVWAWIKDLIENPRIVVEGLREAEKMKRSGIQSLFARREIIENQMASHSEHLDKLLDLYLTSDFPKEVLAERKQRLEDTLYKLQKEFAELDAYIQESHISDAQIDQIEKVCNKIHDRLDNASFDQKRKIIDLLDVRGKLAIEDNEKVVYAQCLISEQPLSVVQTSH